MQHKEALIEQLAELEFDRTIVTFGPRYEQLDEEDRGAYRDNVMRSWPLIVAFVATWIDQNCSHMIASEAAEKWSKEMGDA